MILQPNQAAAVLLNISKVSEMRKIIAILSVCLPLVAFVKFDENKSSKSVYARRSAVAGCRIDSVGNSVALNSVQDIVSVDSTDDPEGGVTRALLSLPTAPRDSVLAVSDSTVCGAALTAYRIQKFHADTGWPTAAAAFRIRNSYAVYVGEVSSFGQVILVFDSTWTYLSSF
ncbi:MAG: hypothetical protein ABJC26_04990 [Gemmatimonadaceae bacterium]